MAASLGIPTLVAVGPGLARVPEGAPVILDDKSDAGQAYSDVVRRYLGEDLEHRFIDEKKSFLGRLFGG